MTPRFITLRTPEGPLILNTARIEYVQEDEEMRTCVVMVGKNEMHVVADSVARIHAALAAVVVTHDSPNP